MDYRDWLRRACGFVADFERRNPEMKAFQDVGTPSSTLELADTESAIGRALPRPLREYLLTASRDAEFSYMWEGEAEVPEFGTKTIAGGIEAFCVLRYIERDFSHCQELAEEGSWGDDPFCRDPLPIAAIGNGDYLALDLAHNAANPRVVYLARGLSFVLAPDFDAFLAAWEAILYLDPSLERPFRRFVDRDAGKILTDDGPDLRALRAAVLGPERA